MKKSFISLCLLLLFFAQARTVFARIGVGVGTGKINIDQELKPGQSYNLPPFNVLNTGDEASDYSVGIDYHENQEQLRPLLSWFTFSPSKFYLEPGGIQTVSVSLELPIRIEPGQYFAFLVAQPDTTSQARGTTIGVAAASKLYFTVTPTNAVLGAYYKSISLWNKYSPWPQIVLAVIAFVFVTRLVKKHVNIKVSLNKNEKNKSDYENE